MSVTTNRERGVDVVRADVDTEALEVSSLRVRNRGVLVEPVFERHSYRSVLLQRPGVVAWLYDRIKAVGIIIHNRVLDLAYMWVVNIVRETWRHEGIAGVTYHAFAHLLMSTAMWYSRLFRDKDCDIPGHTTRR